MSRSRILATLAGLACSIPAFGQASFTVLPTLYPGNLGSSNALGVSPDGSTVVGQADSPLGSQAYRWRASTGMVGLGLPTDWFPDCDCSGFASEATSCSENGDIVTINVIETENGNYKAGYWSTPTGIVQFSPDNLLGARDISADGSTIIGELYTSGGAANGYFWNEGGLQQIESPFIQRLAWGCSADGTVIAGQVGAFPGRAFRWTAGGGVETLPDIPGGPEDGGANAISLDGHAVVGFGSDNVNFQDKFQAMRWTADSGTVGLGRLPGLRLSSAFATNGDGSVVVGNAFNSGSGGLTQKGFIWTDRAGILDLNAVLAQQGVTTMGGFQIIAAQGVSADGLAITGMCMNAQFTTRGFVARLAFRPGYACDPDLNQDGNVDQDDIAYLINVIGGGDNPTGIDPDFNHDGNADQDDIGALINTVGGGGCP